MSLIYPFLNALPKSYDSLLEMWPKVLNPFLMPHVLELKQQANKEFEFVYENIDASFNQLHDYKVPKNNLHYAYAVVITRQIDWPLPLKGVNAITYDTLFVKRILEKWIIINDVSKSHIMYIVYRTMLVRRRFIYQG